MNLRKYIQRLTLVHPLWVAVGCGATLAASYPPLPLGFLSSLAWVPMLLMVKGRTLKQAVLQYFVFGFVASLGTFYWIGNVIAPGLWHLILFGVFFMCCYYGIFFSITGLWSHFFFQQWGPKGLFLTPPFWVLLEYFKSRTEFSFPWCTVGYTWGSYLPLVQALSVFGVYFYSLLILCIAVLLYLWVEQGGKDCFFQYTAAGLGIVLVSLLVGGYAALQRPTKVESTARVGMIQPNIDQLTKWDQTFLDFTFQSNRELSLQTMCDSVPDMVLWSETAMPMYILKRSRYLSQLRDLFDSLQIPVLFGSLDYERVDQKYKNVNFYNCAFWYSPHNKKMARYIKIRLVPFSEYLPLTGIFPVLNAVDLGEADFTAGKEMTLFEHNGIRFVPSICYEIIYPSHIRKMMHKGVNLLINITNDGWFGRTSAPYQHLNMARFRCIENRIWLARCANTGITAIVNAKGQILQKTKIMEKTVVAGNVALTNQPTLYTKYGDWIVGVCALACLAAVSVAIWQHKRDRIDT